MPEQTVKVNLNGTYRWNGKKYGPGQRVAVPQGMAEWLGLSEAPAPPTPSTPKEDTRTVAELKAALDKAAVEYDSDARKDDLLKLAAAAGV